MMTIAEQSGKRLSEIRSFINDLWASPTRWTPMTLSREAEHDAAGVSLANLLLEAAGMPAREARDDRG